MPDTPIVNSLKLIAQVHHSLGAHYEALACHFANEPKTVEAKVDDPPADPPAGKKKAKADKPKEEKPKTEESAKPESKPEMTPDQVAADLKAKLVALVGKDRAKAVALLGTIGAKNFSTIPVEKHAEMLRKIDDALNGKPAEDDDDPLK